MIDIALRPLVKGCASFVVPALRSAHKPGGTIDAEHCYALFLRHYLRLRRHRAVPGVPATVAELGPGSSIGMGLAALLAGAERYVALDVEAHRTGGRDLAVLDRLVELFRARTPAPNHGRYSRIFPPPGDAGFPAELEPALAASLAPESLARLRADVRDGRGERVRYVAPWSDPACLPPGSVDWLFSHSVLEHVDDLDGVYAAMASWLAPGGLMTHLVDFWSHDLTVAWNGHWAINDRLWRLMRGRRPYLLNRAWRRQHLEHLEANGFTVVERRSDGLVPEMLAEPFRAMPDEDARTRMAFIVARRTG